MTSTSLENPWFATFSPAVITSLRALAIGRTNFLCKGIGTRIHWENSGFGVIMRHSSCLQHLRWKKKWAYPRPGRGSPVCTISKRACHQNAGGRSFCFPLSRSAACHKQAAAKQFSGRELILWGGVSPFCFAVRQSECWLNRSRQIWLIDVVTRTSFLAVLGFRGLKRFYDKSLAKLLANESEAGSTLRQLSRDQVLFRHLFHFTTIDVKSTIFPCLNCQRW